MMIIRLTQKLAKKIKEAPTTAAPRAENPFADWTANLFTVGRTQYIILTHSASLYSVVFPGRGVNESDSFIDHAFTALREQMEDAGYGDTFQKHIAPLTGDIRFSKTGDRRVLGSMNDLIQHAQFILADESPAGTAAKLNKTPMGALQYQYPRVVLAKLAGPSEGAKSGAGKVLPFPGMQGKEQGAAVSPSKGKTNDQRPGTADNQSQAVPKSPAQKRAETKKFQNEMLAMFDQLRKPRNKQQLFDEAQNLIYDAWESSPARALKLARQALDLSSDCTDAYLLLADLEARTIRDRLDLIRKGIEAGRRFLGKKFFQENEGHFWGILETRPFMRAMAALANTLWEIGQGDEAIEIWREMLRLNPNDNQGVRYALLSCLLELDRNEEGAGLLECYAGDGGVEWVYGAALLAFRAGGDSPFARRKLSAAQKQNPQVLPYLLGSKKIPKRLPEYISFGDETEAVYYAAANLAAWAKTPGALEWLGEQQNRNSP